MKQSTAVKVLASGANVFLTGAPGSGKTHLLNRFIKYLREREVPLAITAPTGIAATHIGGMTLHSWSGLGIRENVDERLIESLLAKQYLRSRFEKLKVLIIDEVSMLTPGLFESVDTILRNIRFTNQPFGGVQLVLTGDFFQLPPVGVAPGRPRFIWQTELWEQLDPVICYLSERHRQSDAGLIRVLDEMREGGVSEGSREILQKCFRGLFPKHIRPTRLFTHNVDVDRINNEELGQLKGKEQSYSVRFQGKKAVAEKILQGSLVAENLRLKAGAMVIFIKNNFERGYVNGTLGEVTEFDAETGFPVVKTAEGGEILAEPEEWNLTDEKGKKLAAITQIPLRLAWAITVHKSQGMTLDAAEVDLGKAFEPGHGYVALSRVKSLSGLRLLGLNEKSLLVDGSVLQVDEQMRARSKQTEAEYLQKPLTEKYPPLTEEQQKRKKRPTAEITRDFLKQGLSLEQIAAKRELKAGTIVTHLEQLLESGEIDFPITHLFPAQDLCRRIVSAREAVQRRNDPQEKTEYGGIRLGAILREVGDEVTYDEIRLALMRETIARE